MMDEIIHEITRTISPPLAALAESPALRSAAWQDPPLKGRQALQAPGRVGVGCVAQVVLWQPGAAAAGIHQPWGLPWGSRGAMEAP